MADASAPSPTPNNVEPPPADQEPTANGTIAMDVEMKEEPIADVKLLSIHTVPRYILY